ncbi:unnamed protein product [Ixodes pacificus]
MVPRTVHSVCPPRRKGGPAVPHRPLPTTAGRHLPVLPGPCRFHWPPLVTAGHHLLAPAGSFRAHDLKGLGFTDDDLKIMSVRCFEGTAT